MSRDTLNSGKCPVEGLNFDGNVPPKPTSKKITLIVFSYVTSDANWPTEHDYYSTKLNKSFSIQK